jgi:integrase
MARPKSPNPKHIKQKTRGGDRGFVILSGERKYTGPVGSWGTQEAHDTYLRLLAEWITRGRQPEAPAATQSPAAAEAGKGTTVNFVIAAFWQHAKAFYRKPDGTPTNEVETFRSALRPLKALYGPTPYLEFGPKALRAVQEEMVRLGWCRSFINKQTARLKHVFKWAVSQELVPASLYHALATVPGLKRGKTKARERAPIRPVPDADVDAVIPHVSDQIAAMIRLQQYTGMRPGEVCLMRTCDVDQSGKVWTYTPREHKTEHHGHDRTIFLGPKARAVLEKWFRPNLTEYLFSPTEAEAARLKKLHEDRVKGGTPLSRGNRPGTNRVKRPQRKLGNRYDVDAYRKAITRACEVAFGMPDAIRKPPKEGETAEQKKGRLAKARAWRAANCWHPHQLRHNAATFLRKEFGIDAAKIVLGHRTLNVTAIYAEADHAKAQEVMERVG